MSKHVEMPIKAANVIWNVTENTKGMRQLGSIVGLSVLLAIGGCTRASNLNQGGFNNPAPPASLEPAPLTRVDENQLEPVQTEAQQDAAGIPADPSIPEKPVQVANAEAEANAQPVTRQTMVGAWTVSSGGSNCQIFLALTKWSGGYRAASRGCSGPGISDIQAWDVRGKQVVLVDSNGGTAATLYKSAATRFDGSTTGGNAISFSR